MTIYKLPKADREDFAEEYWKLTDKQLDELVKSELEEDRELAARFGRSKDLNVLVNDPSAIGMLTFVLLSQSKAVRRIWTDSLKMRAGKSVQALLNRIEIKTSTSLFMIVQ